MNIGIILSGGAAKCIAHLGVLKALQECGIKPAKISAVSGGALFGSFVAAGLSPDEALDLVITKGMFNIFEPSKKIEGLFSMERVETVYRENLPANTFEQLTIPMVVAATDINSGELVYFDKGDLIKPVIASSSYPAIFEPVEINGHSLLDAGILNNFPVEPLQNECDLIIGVSVGRVYQARKLNTVKKYFFRSLELAINEVDRSKFCQCDLLLEPPGLNEYDKFDMSKGVEIFQKGYNYTMMRSEELKKFAAAN